MKQSVIRVSSFTHTIASATPHATLLDSASLHPGYTSKAHPHAPNFRRSTQRGEVPTKTRNISSKGAKACPERRRKGRKEKARCYFDPFGKLRITQIAADLVKISEQPRSDQIQ